jgi:hypothetical protein
MVLGPETAAAAEVQEARFPESVRASAGRPKAAVGGNADEPPAEKWVVVPVTTELQRVRGGSNTRAYVIVNGEWFRRNRVTLDAKALNVDGLREQLQPYADPEKATVYFYIRCIWKASHMVYEGGVFGVKEGLPSEPATPDYVTHVLRYALIGLGKEAGFRNVIAQVYYHHVDDGQSDGWDVLAAEVEKDAAADAGRDESGIGDQKFKVYPVRTALSRFMYANADCVLHVLGGGGIGPKEAPAIEESVAKLKLKNKRKICFLCPFGPAGWYFTQAKFYKRRLGFETYTHSRPRN